MRHLLPLILLLMVVACSRSPKGVLSKKEMAELLVDVHRGESIVELNTRDYSNDSVKQLMKQSVLARHGVTREEFDSSLMWYGRHIEDYMEVYDIVTERLEDELREMEIAGTAGDGQIELAGDSIDIWSSGRLHRFSLLQPNDNLNFALRRDTHWEKGDIYQWRFRINGWVGQPMQWIVAAEYPDNTVTVASGRASSQGWQTITFPTDTTQMPRAIHGSLIYESTLGATTVIADSISLTRMRLGHRSVISAEPLVRHSTSL